ncbi:hypothetical protein JX266_012523 [Neoarthrinium moseri]|nr:hypothetical protein JX266_012523 [Neoarthrinium moseri]
MAVTPLGDWRSHVYSHVQIQKKDGNVGLLTEINGNIRLLTIQPRSHAAAQRSKGSSLPAIQCFLKLANLTQSPDFIAISHSLDEQESGSRSEAGHRDGDNTKTEGNAQEVLVNGAPVPVSRALYRALESFQRESDPITIWIDALCVNEDDVREKSAQTAQRAAIFSAATRAIVWLGEAADKSDDAMDALGRLVDEQLTPTVQKLWIALRGKLPMVAENATHDHASSEKQPSLDDQLHSLRTSIQLMMNRQYWRRIWSLQELAFTAKGEVSCGNRSLDIDRFFLAAKSLDGILNMATYSKWLASTQIPGIAPTLDTTEPANFSKTPAIRRLTERESFRQNRGWSSGIWWHTTEEPLFSVLARYHIPSARNDSQTRLVTKDPRDLIYAFHGLASDTQELKITTDYSKDYDQVCVDTTMALLRKDPKILQLSQGQTSAGTAPSWIVDWSKVRVPPSSDPAHPFRACGPADERFYRFNTDSPHSIKLTGAFVDTVKTVTKSAPLDVDADSRKELMSLDDLLKQSLDGEGCPYKVDQQLDIPAGMVPEDLFITETGYVGFSYDAGIDAGDRVAVFYGSHVPFLLRRSDETFRIVGEAYVHGIMNGEFMSVHRQESTIRLS